MLYILFELLFPSNRELSENCSKERMLHRLLMLSPFKCKITHIKVPKLVIVHNDRFSVI